MRYILILSALLVSWAGCPHTGSAAQTAPAGNFLLIGWDGAQRSQITKMLGEGKLPNLAKLIKEGGLVETSVVTGKTQTKPGWAEILTGYDSSMLKVFSNVNYQPIPKGYTVFERLKTRFDGSVKTIFITGKPYNLGARGPHSVCVNAYNRDPETLTRTHYQEPKLFQGKTEDGKPPRWEPRAGEPYFNALWAIDYHSVANDKAEVVGKKATEALEKYRETPFFAFIHFQEPDEQGHLYREGSPQYIEALGRVDTQLGDIVKQLERLGLYSKTTIFVTADHGFNIGKYKHNRAPFMTLAFNCARKLRNGDRKDVTVTILDWYGFDLKEIKPALDGRTLFIK